MPLAPEASFALPLPADYRPEDVLRRLGLDQLSLDETITGEGFTKAALLDSEGRAVPAIFRVTLAPGIARGTVFSSRSVPQSAIAHAEAIARRMLGLLLDPAPFEARAEQEELVARLIAPRRGLRIALTATVFEGVTWAILGQQVNLAFAATLRRRLIELCGQEAVEGYRVHPTAAAVAVLEYDDLTPLQFSRRKAEYLIDTARLATSGELALEHLAELPFADAEARLLSLRGFGPWSTHYLLMRACGFPDCIPLGDTGLREATRRFYRLEQPPAPLEAAELTRVFAPHRSLATFHLWRSLAPD